MKKLLLFLLPCILLLLSGCTDKPNGKASWQDYFSCDTVRVEQSNFDNSEEEFEAILNGTFVYAHREYTITNKTDTAFENVYLKFLVVPLDDGDNFTFEVYAGNISPRGTYQANILDSEVEIELRQREIPTDQWWTIALSDIRYETSK